MLLKQTNGLICRKEESVLLSRCEVPNLWSKYRCPSISLLSHYWKSGVWYLSKPVLGQMWAVHCWDWETLSSLNMFKFLIEGNWSSKKKFQRIFLPPVIIWTTTVQEQPFNSFFCVVLGSSFCVVNLACYYTFPTCSFWWGTVSTAAINEAKSLTLALYPTAERICSCHSLCLH